jgi:sugar O-acyltransferase (sialic acid O-acetyltransferase NeuD family)
MKDLVIFGAGGLGSEVLELVNNINKKSAIWNVIGFYDDYVQAGSVVSCKRVLGGLEDLRQSDFKNVVIAIGNPEVRANLMLSLFEKEFPVLIHPNVVIPEISVSIGSGCIIAANTYISANTIIDKGVLINVGCSIGHDVEIGKFCTINPGSRVSGNVKMGEAVFVGVGAILNNNITITSGVKIGAGAVVLKSVNKKSTLFGNPARIMIE